jgi:hypothetical protein
LPLLIPALYRKKKLALDKIKLPRWWQKNTREIEPVSESVTIYLFLLLKWKPGSILDETLAVIC